MYIPPQNIMVHNIMMEKLSKAQRLNATKISPSLFKDLPSLDNLKTSKSNGKVKNLAFRAKFKR